MWPQHNGLQCAAWCVCVLSSAFRNPGRLRQTCPHSNSPNQIILPNAGHPHRTSQDSAATAVRSPQHKHPPHPACARTHTRTHNPHLGSRPGPGPDNPPCPPSAQAKAKTLHANVDGHVFPGLPAGARQTQGPLLLAVVVVVAQYCADTVMQGESVPPRPAHASSARSSARHLCGEGRQRPPPRPPSYVADAPPHATSPGPCPLGGAVDQGTHAGSLDLMA